MCTQAHVLIQKSVASVSAGHTVLCKTPSFPPQGVNTSWLPPASTGIKPIPCTAPRTPITWFKKERALSISYSVPQRNPTQGHIWPVIISWLFFFPRSLELSAEEANSDCYQNIHCPRSETMTGQISQRRSHWGMVYFMCKRQAHWKSAVITL